MPRKTDGTPPAKSWADRKGKFKSIQIDRDLAEMIRDIGADSDPAQSIAEVINGLIRRTVEEKWRARQERRLKDFDRRRATG